MIIRAEMPNDIAAIRYVLEHAFYRTVEANLVEALRDRDVLTFSLVATDGDRVIGHIAFSPVTIGDENLSLKAVGLAPVAVLPEYQRQGIGSQLIEIGIEKCHKTGQNVIFVLGNPAFYSRFGFVAAATYGIRYEGDVPPEAFMVKELSPGILANSQGVAHYQLEFQTC
jgi:putative acetyltransferase